MRSGRSRLAGLLGRAGTASVWAFLLIVVAATVNFIGIRVAGNTDAWQRWMKEHAGWFLGWRLILYGATVAGWIWMRRRLMKREPDPAAHYRLLRVEIAAVAAFIALEASLLLRSG